MEEVSRQHLDKINKAYLNINTTTFSHERQRVVDMFGKSSFVTHEKPDQSMEGRKRFLMEVKRHNFVICPRGNGIDTHRLWETLYMGSIPVVIYSDVHKNLLDLPILFIKDWSELTEELMNNTLAAFDTRLWNMRKLGLDYWINCMRSKTNITLQHLGLYND
jgi:hypothetical protein